MNKKTLQKLASSITEAHDILIIQADNPDADSLGSSLALEQILHLLGKDPVMFCKVNMPAHLRYIDGWDRVVNTVESDFDMAIVVDCSSKLLLEAALDHIGRRKFSSRPLYVIDHHTSEATLENAELILDPTAVASSEQVYHIAKALGYDIGDTAGYAIIAGIMADSLGLTSDKTTSRAIKVVADLVEQGVRLYELENKRRELMRRDADITELKGKLIQQIEYNVDSRVASIDIGWDVINKYSNRYNPSILVMDEMRLTLPVEIAIAYKTYPNGRITGKLRSNLSAPYCHLIAEDFGGGGHPHSAGFRVTDGSSLSEVKNRVNSRARELLDQEPADETN